MPDPASITLANAENQPVTNQAEPMGLNLDYVAPPFTPETEREHEAKSRGRREGYFEGRNDLLYALAHNHGWALKLVEDERAKYPAEATLAQPARAQAGVAELVALEATWRAEAEKLQKRSMDAQGYTAAFLNGMADATYLRATELAALNGGE